MKHLLYVASILLLTVLTCIACTPDEKSFTGEDNGKTIELNQGESFTITLASNPTTGYMWAVESVDTTVLTPDAAFDYQSQSDLIGGGGAESIGFKAIEAGETTIQLKYWRSFEPDVDPIDTFSLHVIVK